MNDTIKVICENGFGELEVPMGTPLLEVAERLTPGLHPFLAAFVKMCIRDRPYPPPRSANEDAEAPSTFQPR